MSTNVNSGATKLMTFSDMGNTAAFYQTTKPVRTSNGNNNITLKTQPKQDTLDKKDDNKKKTLIKSGMIAAGIALAVAGFFVLKGNGKKVSQAGMSATTKVSAGANEAAIQSNEKITDEAAQRAKEFVDGFNNPQLKMGWYRPTPISFDETSIENDMAQWVQRFQKAPQETGIIQHGKPVRLNNPIDIKELSGIKPHNYLDTSDIFINTRTLRAGFPDGFAIVDGKLSEVNASYNNYVDYAVGKNKNGNNYGYRTGISKDGRACVELHFKENRQDEAGRMVHTHILLRSKDRNYTQDQLDAIKMFQNIDEEKIAIESPLGAAFMQEEEGSKNLTSLFFNKNTFLSIIKDEADKYKDFDVQGFLAKGNAERYVDDYAVIK